jgi:glutamyl endopeptidase
LLAVAVIVGCALFFAPGTVVADEPITVNTIVSRSGAHWNAPPSAEPFFPAYAPPAAPESANYSFSFPELGRPANSLALRAPGSIIGKDGRTRIQDTRVFPYRALVFLRVDFGGYTLECTGALIGAHMVATAGHCVRDPSLGWATGARVYPALNGTSAPYEMALGTEFYSVTGWLESFRPEFDYGAIRLDKDAGSETGWFGMTVFDKPTLRKLTVRVTGYPADKPYKTMWTMAGPLRRVTALRLFYDIDTYAGQSGSPIYDTTVSRACSYCVVGIHGYGVGGDPRARFNSGVRITHAVLDNFVAWRKLP